MKLTIKENTINPTELKRTLTDEFSNKYTVTATIPTLTVVAKSKIIGTKVILRKNSLHVVGGFPTTFVQLIFTLLFVLLGIVIPLILYFIFLHKKMKSFEHEIATFIKENYKAEIIL